ncbi:MAG: hypothetical protein JWP74_3973 [Marmoricola sp.]|nr:hypothetical protein [Marmoricola sp.]
MVAGLVAAALLLAACSDNTSIAPPKASGDISSSRETGARGTLAALADALGSGDAGAVAALADAGSRGLLEAMVGNVARLGLTDVSLRFVDDDPSQSPQDTEDLGPNAWIATVEVTYRLSRWDMAPTRVETPMTFTPGIAGGRAQVVAGVGGDDGRTPIWMTGVVRAIAYGRTLVISAGDHGGRDSVLARRAIVAVNKVLPSWKGDLVIEAPADETGLDQALGATQPQYADIAAVTASVDGSLVRTAPVHVFLNPRVFDPLGPRGAQVVISHESTHVATRATFASLPTWLKEGFADYVALAHAGIPVRTAAAQILARIRRSGPPDHLPTSADLDPTAVGLGATYEEAWLANRFISTRYGEPKLVSFYETVSGGENLDLAFRRVLGTTQVAFVRAWRSDLRILARRVTG